MRVPGRVIGTATRVGPHRAILGECPVWDEGSVHWIDCVGAQILTTDVTDGSTTALALPERPGSIVPVSGGGLACAAGHEVFHLGREEPGTCIAALKPGSPGRFNDGKCDARGRLWVGTAFPSKEPICALYRVEAGTADPVVSGVGMSNGIGWSPDGATMYYVDTGTGRLDAFRFDAAAGAVDEGRTLRSFNPPLLPDGLAVDVEGGIWLAIWSGACVVRLRPSGDIDGTVRVPAGFVTSCAFGGEGNATLFITTARGGAEPDDQGGALFHFATGVAKRASFRIRAGCSEGRLPLAPALRPEPAGPGRRPASR